MQVTEGPTLESTIPHVQQSEQDTQDTTQQDDNFVQKEKHEG